jgi:hypothetical protein
MRLGSGPQSLPHKHWDHTVVGEPGVVCVVGETDDLGADIPRQLHGDRAHATGGGRDDDRVACLQRNCLHCRISRGSRDEQGPRLLPRNVGGAMNEMVSLDDD